MALLRTHQKVRCGAVAFPQRFGGSLNLNVHYHVVVPDVVFVIREGDSAATHLQLSPPSPSDLEEVLHNTACRVIAWLKRRGYVNHDESSDPAPRDPELHAEAAEPSALATCLQSSLGVGELDPGPSRTKTVVSGEPSPPKRPRGDAVAAYGFNLHAGVRVNAGEPEGLERLLRYCARAPLSSERLAQPDDETITYQVQHGNQVRVMTPMQFMARLAALIPPPRHPLIRFHGVFEPHSRFRKQVVPVRAEVRSKQPAACGGEAAPNGATPADPASPVPSHGDSVKVNSSSGEPARPARETETTSRNDWATLLRRVYTVDALACPGCGDRMRFTDLFDQRHLARQELARRGLATHPPPLARARSPDSCWD